MTLKSFWDGFLNQAQKAFLLNQVSHHFEYKVRAPKGKKESFYQELDHFLKEHKRIQIREHKEVKEGFVKVARPSVLSLDLDTLLFYRPQVRSLKEIFNELKKLLEPLSLESFLELNYSDWVAHPSESLSAVKVFLFLVNDVKTRRSFIYPRQLSHSESTKVLEQSHYVLQLYRLYKKRPETRWSDFYYEFKLLKQDPEFRFFASHCCIDGVRHNDFHGLLSKSWAERFSFQNLDLKFTLVVENKQSFMALTKALNYAGFLLWGGGWKASALVSHLERAAPRPIFYWGDLDKEGYEIYAHLKERLPHLKALCMDMDCLHSFKASSSEKARHYGPFVNLFENQEVYEKVCREGLMLEQEKIPINYALLHLDRLKTEEIEQSRT